MNEWVGGCWSFLGWILIGAFGWGGERKGGNACVRTYVRLGVKANIARRLRSLAIWRLKRR